MNHPTTDTIDTAQIAVVVRKVIARMKEASNHQTTDHPITNRPITTHSAIDSTTTTIADHVVCVATIESLGARCREIVVTAKAIVTPAAHDEAKLRGITINRCTDSSRRPTTPTSSGVSSEASGVGNEWIVDREKPERAAAMRDQLSRRGVTSIGSTIVLSETPAKDVFRYCNTHAQRAVMLSSINDIDRFAIELQPTVWVLDMQRMNFMAAVNAASQIAQKS